MINRSDKKMSRIKSALLPVVLLTLFCISIFSLSVASALNPVQVQITSSATSTWSDWPVDFTASASGGTGSYTYQQKDY
jgi:hypothetical protein